MNKCDICGKEFKNIQGLSGHSRIHSTKINDKRNKKKLDYQNYIDIPSGLFLNNKYTKLYYQIIQSARKKEYDRYTEKHHILPKSLGGSNKWNNLIILSAREHFLCHYLLTKMIEMKTKHYHKMLNAFMIMKGNPNTETIRYINSRLYNSVKSFHSKIQSNKVTGKNNPNYGKTWVSCPKQKISTRIKKEDLNKYISKGWVKKRITDFSLYDENLNLIKKPKKKKQIIVDCTIYPKMKHGIIKNTKKILNLPDDHVVTYDDVDKIYTIINNHLYVDNLSPNDINKKYKLGYVSFHSVLIKCFKIKLKTENKQIKKPV